VADAELLDERERPPSTLRARQVAEGELDVFERREVREEREVLEDVADAAQAYRQVDAPLGVEEHLAADGDAAGVGADEPGD
jgi:hypothetical protein